MENFQSTCQIANLKAYRVVVYKGVLRFALIKEGTGYHGLLLKHLQGASTYSDPFEVYIPDKILSLVATYH